jgi:hypothetical protein
LLVIFDAPTIDQTRKQAVRLKPTLAI